MAHESYRLSEIACHENNVIIMSIMKIMAISIMKMASIKWLMAKENEKQMAASQ